MRPEVQLEINILKKILLFSDFDTKTFGSWQIFSSAFSNLHITCPEAHFRDSFRSLRTCFVSFGNLSKNIPKGLSKILSMSPRHRFERKNYIFQKKCFFPCLSDLQLNFSRPSVKKLRVGCPNCILRVHRSVFFEVNVFFGKLQSFFKPI